MKSFIAIVALALAATVAASPAPVEKRQASIVCVPAASPLAGLSAIISLLGLGTCAAPETCVGVSLVDDILGVSRSPLHV